MLRVRELERRVLEDEHGPLGYLEGLQLTLVGDSAAIAEALAEEDSCRDIFEVILEIEPGPFGSFAALKNFQNLEHLLLQNPTASQLTDIASIGLHLKELTLIDGKYINNLISFEHFNGQVQSLELRDFSDLDSLQGIERIQSLHELRIYGINNYLRDISEIGKLQDLQDLYLSGMSTLTDISPLRHLTQLVSLAVTGCPSVIDVSPLQILENLENLRLSFCSNVIDISPIGSLQNLANLWIVECPKIVDVAALGKLKQLNTLLFLGCHGISYYQIANLKSDLPGCKIVPPWQGYRKRIFLHELAVEIWLVFMIVLRWLRLSR